MIMAIKLMNIFLKMRAWELFFLFIIPVLAGFLIPKNLEHNLLPFVNLLFFILIIGWLYSVGINANRLLIKEIQINDTFFRLNIAYFLGYVVVLFFNVGSLKSILFDESSFAVLFSVYFIFAVSYCFYFSSKVLVMYEIKRNVSFNNHRKEFFLLIIFLIGIWILQPRINKLVATV